MSDTLPVAYSDLPRVLAKRRLNIADLLEKLRADGINVNQKSLYRLTTALPLHKIDTRIVGGICRTCDVGIQDIITFSPPKPALEKLGNAQQKRLDELMAGHNEGQLTATELRELDELSEQAHRITMANARKLAAQRRSLTQSSGSALAPSRTPAHKRPRK